MDIDQLTVGINGREYTFVQVDGVFYPTEDMPDKVKHAVENQLQVVVAEDKYEQ